jgi:hypothetical protein
MNTEFLLGFGDPVIVGPAEYGRADKLPLGFE